MVPMSLRCLKRISYIFNSYYRDVTNYLLLRFLLLLRIGIKKNKGTVRNMDSPLFILDQLTVVG